MTAFQSFGPVAPFGKIYNICLFLEYRKGCGHTDMFMKTAENSEITDGVRS